jgi:proteasome lid subunit RPN8/RPN11
MSDEMHFGDVEEIQPEKNLRPDRNRHFAVVPYGKPNEKELPIFVDLDVLLDMEAHAASDKTVELGGVMLGGHYHDADGRAFVVVTDSLRAEHYESTKGSFKFTHETWEKISRQRDEFPEDLQMAGWYHTHPDWGVFLSGMDHFICDHFFNKLLDVAYVIDPCRLDRAFFQWTGRPGEKPKRTGGFYVMASRFRAAELEQTVQMLEGKITMPTYTGGAGGSPIINVQAPPPPPKPAWENLGMLGMLALQFALVALIAWKLITPPEATNAEALAKLEKVIEARDATAQHERDMKIIHRVLEEVKETPAGFTARYQDEIKKNEDLQTALRNSHAANEHAAEQMKRDLQKLNDQLSEQGADLKAVEGEVAVLKNERTKLRDDLATREKTIAELEKKLNPEGVETAQTGIFVWPPTTRTYILLGVIVGVAIAGGTGFWLRSQGQSAADEQQADPLPSGEELKAAREKVTSSTVRDPHAKKDEPEAAA